MQLLREPSEIVKQRRAEEAAANAGRRKEALDKADERVKMKGKNKPTRRQKKKQMNVIEERKPTIKARQEEEVRVWGWVSGLWSAVWRWRFVAMRCLFLGSRPGSVCVSSSRKGQRGFFQYNGET